MLTEWVDVVHSGSDDLRWSVQAGIATRTISPKYKAILPVRQVI